MTKRVPNLFVIGAPRCGTSTLFAWLTAHPEIAGTEPKEPFVLLDTDHPLLPKRNFHNVGWDSYTGMFTAKAKTAKYHCESSTHYLYSDFAFQTITAVRPLPKVIIMLREPSARVVSSFDYTKNNLAGFSRDISLAQYLTMLQKNAFVGSDYLHEPASAYVLERDLDYSRYDNYLPKWQRALGPACNILVLEEMAENPKAFMHRLALFLAIDPAFYETFAFARHNSSISIKQLGTHRISRRVAERLPAGAIRNILRRLYYKVQNRGGNASTPSDKAAQASLYDAFADPRARVEQLLARPPNSLWPAPAWHLPIDAILRCPTCGQTPLVRNPLGYSCYGCRTQFPNFSQAKVLLDPDKSVFDVPSQYVEKPKRWYSGISAIMPTLSTNISAASNFLTMRKRLAKGARILIIGGRVPGAGLGELLHRGGFGVLTTDASYSPLVDVVCDAHDLPFADQTFDAVVAQAVFEHVANPVRCVAESHRVLKPGGLLYAEVPFMQQVHAGAYDFTRYTHSGLRLLLGSFREVHSGVACGPWMGLAWSIQHAGLSLLPTPSLRTLWRGFTRLSLFWLKYLDRLIPHQKTALDGASAIYFLGEKTDSSLTARDVIQKYETSA